MEEISGIQCLDPHIKNGKKYYKRLILKGSIKLDSFSYLRNKKKVLNLFKKGESLFAAEIFEIEDGKVVAKSKKLVKISCSERSWKLENMTHTVQVTDVEGPIQAIETQGTYYLFDDLGIGS
jgi:hypothetical protein